MTPVEKILYRTRKTLRAACIEAGIDFCPEVTLSQCEHCDVWFRSGELRPDLDKNTICATCYTYEGA